MSLNIVNMSSEFYPELRSALQTELEAALKDYFTVPTTATIYYFDIPDFVIIDVSQDITEDIAGGQYLKHFSYVMSMPARPEDQDYTEQGYSVKRYLFNCYAEMNEVYFEFIKNAKTDRVCYNNQRDRYPSTEAASVEIAIADESKRLSVVAKFIVNKYVQLLKEAYLLYQDKAESNKQSLVALLS